MRLRIRNRREDKQGGALIAALLFMTATMISGTALLGISMIHRLDTIRNGIDVRLMIATEAAVESVRGRFTLIQGVQEDWSWLSTTTWTTVATPTINGITVNVQAQLNTGISVPTAKVRGTASAAGKTRIVEYIIKSATFSDYAVFKAGSGDTTLGTNFKQVGNYYLGGNLLVPNAGSQVYGDTYMVGSVSHTNGEAWNYTFPYANPLQNQTPIPMPTWAAPWNSLKTVATGFNTLYAENTLEIEFLGTTMRRTYVRRRTATAGDGTIPTGVGWLTLSTGARNYAHSSLNNADYEVIQEVVNIPDEGVIYVQTGAAKAISSTMDTTGGDNGFVQDVSWPATGGSTTDANIVANFPTIHSASSNTYIPILMISGVLDDRRVSLVCDHKIIVRDTITYQTLLDNPELRRFNGNGVDGKESPAALGFKEMLGVMSRNDVHLTPTWWNNLRYDGPGDPDNEGVENQTGELIPNHHPDDTYATDGVFFALGNTRPFRYVGGQLAGEWWGHGGLIAGGSTGAGLGNHFQRRNYDWDFRLKLTTPPYFLRAYNTTAIFVPGTWRTWEP